MAGRADRAAPWLAAARDGSRDALGQALEACRNYLLLIADRELGADLRPKGGASDLVQETFIEAQRDFDRFGGATEAEWLAWLRQLLKHRLANFRRRYRQARLAGIRSHRRDPPCRCREQSAALLGIVGPDAL